MIHSISSFNSLVAALTWSCAFCNMNVDLKYISCAVERRNRAASMVLLKLEEDCIVVVAGCWWWGIDTIGA